MPKVLTLNPLTNRQEYIEIILGYPSPYFAQVNPATLLTGMASNLTITGSYFTPSMAVAIGGVTVNNIQFISSNEIAVDVTAGNTVGQFDLILNNGNQTVISNAIEIIELSNAIVDLRLNGTAFSNAAIQMRSGMSFTRTANGLQFAGAQPWSSWARFVGDNGDWTWQRNSISRKLSWIFTNAGAFMLGIGSDQTNETSTSQFAQGEITAYLTSSTSFWGFYGNNGTVGSSTSQSIGANLTSGSIKKLVLENNGVPGSNFYVYELPSADINDWMDTSNLKHEGVIANNMAANSANIMPFAIPRTTSQDLFLGFILE